MEIRDIRDGKLEVSELIAALNMYRDSIEKINFKADERLIITVDGKETTLEKALDGFTIKEFSF